MKKKHKIFASIIFSLAIIMLIIVLAWNPCDYAMIVPAFLFFVAISYLIVARLSYKNENSNQNTNNCLLMLVKK